MPHDTVDAAPGHDTTLCDYSFKGRVIFRGDADYEVARVNRLFNKRIPARYPEAILQAEVEKDLVEAVRLANDRGWTIAVRSGGHSFPAWSLRDGGLLVDLGSYKELSFDAETGIVSATPSIFGGAELNPYLKSFGRFFPGGGCPTVAIGGFLLQGGIGWNFRGWGYASERIVAIDVVTADGKLIRADEHQNSDLLWAVKGVGPGFCGLITRFYLRTVPILEALSVSSYIFRIEDYSDVLAWAWSINKQVSDKVYFYASARVATRRLPNHDGGLAFTVSAIAFCDAAEEAKAALAPIAQCPIRGKALSIIENISVTVEQLIQITDDNHPADMYYRVDSAWVSGPREEIIRACKDLVVNRPSTGPGVTFFCFKLPSSSPNSAMTLETELLIGNYVISQDIETDTRRTRWLLDAMSKIHPYTVGQYWGDSDQQLRSVRCLTDDAWAKFQDIRTVRDPECRFASHLGRQGDFDNVNDWSRAQAVGCSPSRDHPSSSEETSQ